MGFPNVFQGFLESRQNGRTRPGVAALENAISYAGMRNRAGTWIIVHKYIYIITN